MAFATLWKGFTALGLQSYTTATKLGIYDELREEMNAFFPPFGEQVGVFLEKNVESLPKKAYRWIGEMGEIDSTHQETGFNPGVFKSIAEVYGFISEGTEVGKRRAKDAKAGEVVQSVLEGLEKKK